MKRITAVIVMLLLCAVWAIAQQSNASSRMKEITVTGCLSRDGGTFTLTDMSGKSYQLTGNMSQFSDRVGHKVEIKGSVSQSSGTPSSASAPDSEQPLVDVSSMKNLSKKCSPPKNAPMSEKPPVPPQ